jgi:hypothetical protein
MEKLKLLLGFNWHRPPGTPDEEMERLFTCEIKPALHSLGQYPKMSAAIHMSGALLYWIERRHQDFYVWIEELLSRKQAELLGGGFYEPMLPLLSPIDKNGQIDLFTTYLRRQFGKRPIGAYVPDEAWEQSDIFYLNACGMLYTFLPCQRFIASGAREDELFGPFMTEDSSRTLTVAPFWTADAAHVRNGEAYSEWLSHLLRLAENCRNPVIPLFFHATQAGKADEAPNYVQCLAALNALGESVEWTLPVNEYKTTALLPRIYFQYPSRRVILAKDAAVNRLYAKTQFASILVNQVKGDRQRKRFAREEYWRASSFDLYMDNAEPVPDTLKTRAAAYSALISAEKTAREGKGRFISGAITFDFDFDGL